MKQRPNILLIVMDTVRADHISSYGYHRKTTPNIDKLAREGMLFKNAFTTASWTPPAHASILSGKYPFQHKTMGQDIRFKEKYSIAEVLRSVGYQTIGITDCGLLSSLTRFDKGFQEFINTSEIQLLNKTFIKEKMKDVYRTLVQGFDSHTYRINEIIKKTLKNRKYRENPFFLFLNYFNVHVPFNPPRPFKNKFLSYGNSIDNKRMKYITSGKAKYPYIKGEFHISDREWEVVKAFYDGELSYLDFRIGELIKFLKNEGFFENTLIIITADHGEHFGEHGLFGHVQCLYDELLHVPLIMSYPNKISNNAKITNIVSTIDIYRTIIDVIDIKTPINNLGINLLNNSDENSRIGIFAQNENKTTDKEIPIEKNKKCKCIRTKSFKYINSPETEDELYDLLRDPSENFNIAIDYPKKVEYFKNEIKKITKYKIKL